MALNITARDPGQFSIGQGWTGNSQNDYAGVNWAGPNPAGNPAFMAPTITGNEVQGFRWGSPPGYPSNFDSPILSNSPPQYHGQTNWAQPVGPFEPWNPSAFYNPNPNLAGASLDFPNSNFPPVGVTTQPTGWWDNAWNKFSGAMNNASPSNMANTGYRGGMDVTNYGNDR
jgi:hypothetical protein